MPLLRNTVLTLLTLILALPLAAGINEKFFYSAGNANILLEKHDDGIYNETGTAVMMRIMPDGAIDLYTEGNRLASFTSDFSSVTMHSSAPLDIFGKTVAPGTYHYNGNTTARTVCQKQLNRWAGRKLPTSFKSAQHRNIYLGNAIDELEANFDVSGDTWQPDGFPEKNGLAWGARLMEEKRVNIDGKNHTIYLFGEESLRDDNKIEISDIYIVPDGYRRAYTELPSRDGAEPFDRDNALNSPPVVVRLVVHATIARDPQAYMGAVVYEQIYDETSGASSGLVYEMQLPDDIADHFLDIRKATANPRLKENLMERYAVPTYAMMPRQPAGTQGDAMGKAITHYKNIPEELPTPEQPAPVQTPLPTPAPAPVPAPTVPGQASTPRSGSNGQAVLLGANLIKFISPSFGLLHKPVDIKTVTPDEIRQALKEQRNIEAANTTDGGLTINFTGQNIKFTVTPDKKKNHTSLVFDSITFAIRTSHVSWQAAYTRHKSRYPLTSHAYILCSDMDKCLNVLKNNGFKVTEKYNLMDMSTKKAAPQGSHQHLAEATATKGGTTVDIAITYPDASLNATTLLLTVTCHR